MKRFLLPSALFFLFLSSASAQLQKGNIMVGADLANINIGLSKSGIFNLNLNPKAAWFIRDNIALGAYVNTGISTAKGDGTTINYGVGPLARYYINDKTLNLVNHSRFFIEGNFGIEGKNISNGASTNGFGLGIGPGLAYFITPNIGLEALVKYNGILGFGSATSTSDVNIGLGFQIYLPGAKVKNDIKNLK